MNALAGAAPWSWVCAIAAAVAVLSSLAATALQLRRDAQRKTAVAFALPLASLAVLVVGCLIGVARGRALIEGAALAKAGDPVLVATAVAQGITLQLDLLAMNGSLLVGAGGLTVLGWLASSLAEARREQRAATPSVLSALGLSLPLLAATYISLPYLLTAVHTFARITALPGDEKTRAVSDALASGYAQLAGARVILLVAIAGSIAALLVAAAQRARAGKIFSNRALAGAAALFAVGAAAFLGTRAIAFDAAHPLALFDDGTGGSSELASAPRSAKCAQTATRAPILRFGDPVRLNGRPVRPQQLAEALNTLSSNELFLDPNRKPRESNALLVAAPEFSPAEAAPFLQAALQAHLEHFTLVTVAPRATNTRTVGELARPEACAWPVVLDAHGAPLAKFSRWSELADAAQRSIGPLLIAP